MAHVEQPSSGKHGLFATKDVDQLVAETQEEGSQLKKAVGTLDLTALGVGAIIGTGIFVIIGEAIGDAGPAIVLSFVLAGVTCVFSALSYAELSSSIPVAGSAYTYSYATMGEFMAWIIGWDLVLEYGVAVAAVAVGWGAYLSELLDSLFGFTLPESISAPPGDGGTLNLPAAFLVLAVAALLVAGVRESARANTVMVCVKVGILVLFCILAVTAFNGDHFSDFTPNGVDGIVDGAALIFFAYIGFDAISTGSEEAKDPAKSLPIAIIGALTIATILYILVSVTAVGALSADELNGSDAPLSKALADGAGMDWAADLVSFGALIAITSVVLTVLFGQTRIAFTMSRDGLLPRAMGRTGRRGTPVVATIAFAIPIALIAAVVPLAEIAKLVNIGTLFAFILVNAGVIWLRRTKPDLDRGYRVPFVPVFPIIGIALCVYLMSKLEGATWARFGAWLAVGVVIYFAYGYRNSRLRKANAAR